MALDTLPDDGIIVKTRDAFRTMWLRCFKIRQPLASIAQDTQPWIDASVMADVLAPMSANARTMGRSIPLSEVSGDRLDQRLAEYGMPQRFPQTGSQGSVRITASTSGTTIAEGDELTDLENGLRFKCVTTGLYADQSSVPVTAIDTGTQTNLDAGKVLVWSTGHSGLFASCIVVQQTDGTGFSGGRAAESDDEVRARISSTLANPASAGNDAAYQRLVENSLGHGVSVEKCFTYPAINGPGTIGVAFTMKPAVTGGSRRPNSTQIALVQSYVTGQMPADDSYLPITINRQAVNFPFEVSWADGASTWADVITWPDRFVVGAGQIVVSVAANATSFTLVTDNAIYAGVRSPVIGNNIGFYDASGSGAFRRKKLLTVTGTGPWVCTVDTSNGSSDTTYTPVVGQPACPWSDSLNSVVSPIVTYYNGLGPGEQVASFFDPGLRQRRSPVAPKNWPNRISSKVETDLNALSSVGDIRVGTDVLGYSTTVGTPGVNSNLIELGFISVFPIT